MRSSWKTLSACFVPAAVYQSITIGGGYGTGREIVEFFTRFGALGGALGTLVAGLCIAAIIAASFEFARTFKVYDYRSFMVRLVGRWAVLYEILILASLILILSVTGAAAGQILSYTFGTPVWLGVVGVLASVVVLNYFGRDVVTRVLSIWTVLRFIAFIAFFVFAFLSASRQESSPDVWRAAAPGWWTAGLQYALYNVAAVPMILYAARKLETRREAAISGVLAALFVVVPGCLFHIAFAHAPPQLLDESLPTYWLIHRMAVPGLMAFYSIVLFGTLIETSAGVMQGVNERVDAWRTAQRKPPLSKLSHAAISGSATLISTGLSTVGIVGLVAHGYGTAAWCFLVVYVAPVLLIGLWRVSRNGVAAR